MDARHWDDFRVDGLPNFPNQPLLNLQLAKLPAEFRFDRDDAEPMTVLLLVAHESLQTLAQYTDERDKNLRDALDTIRKLSGSMPPPTLRWKPTHISPLSASGINTPPSSLLFPKPPDSAWEIPADFVEAGKGEVEAKLPEYAIFYPIRAHMALYSFFNNYSTLLDRFAIKLNALFALGLGARPDWGSLFDKTGACKVGSKDPGLSATATRFNNSLVSLRVLDFRNVLDHEGYLAIVVKPNEKKGIYEIFLPSEPRDLNKPVNVDAIPFATERMKELIVFLNESYGILLAKLSTSAPPW